MNNNSAIKWKIEWCNIRENYNSTPILTKVLPQIIPLSINRFISFQKKKKNLKISALHANNTFHHRMAARMRESTKATSISYARGTLLPLHGHDPRTRSFVSARRCTCNAEEALPSIIDRNRCNPHANRDLMIPSSSTLINSLLLSRTSTSYERIDWL